MVHLVLPFLFVYVYRNNIELKSCQVIASDKSNLLRKDDFLPKTGFQVIAFFILLDVVYTLI